MAKTSTALNPWYTDRSIISTLELSDTNFRIIRQRLMKNADILVYLGSAMLPRFRDAGLFFDEYPATTKSAIFWNAGRSYELGFADNSSILPEVVREKIDPKRFPAMVMVMKLTQNKRYFSE